MDNEIPKEIETELILAVKLKARGKALEKEGKAISKAAGDTLLPLMSAYGLKSYAVDGLGKAISKVSSGKSINESKLKTQLLLKGLDVPEIDDIIKASATTWSTEYIEFRGV